MDRLTFEGNFCDIAMCQETLGGSFCEDGYCSQRKVWERLKQYEDTGLAPEKIKELEADWCVANQLIQEYKSIGKVEHALALLKAENDGRLVVLPCGEDAELERDGHTFRADHWNHSLTAFRDAPETKSGKQVALFSIEEAETALKGGEG